MRVLVIVNVRSGTGGGSGLYDFVRTVGMTGAEVVMRFADEDRPLEALVADAHDFDRVVAAGGDGTFSAICYALRDSGIPVLAYPAGTANLLALNLGLPMDARSLADLVLNGDPVRFDLGEIEQTDLNGTTSRTGFAMIAGAGFDATIMQNAQPLKSTLGAAAYLLAAVSNLAPTVSEFELVLDGEHVHTDGIAVLFVNFGKIQFDLAVSRGWDPRDGKLDVVVVRTKNVAGLIPVVFAAVMDRLAELPDRNPSVDVYSASQVELSAYPPLAMQYDGEALRGLTPCSARVLPDAATLIVPPGSQYAPVTGS